MDAGPQQDKRRNQQLAIGAPSRFSEVHHRHHVASVSPIYVITFQNRTRLRCAISTHLSCIVADPRTEYRHAQIHEQQKRRGRHRPDGNRHPDIDNGAVAGTAAR